MKNSAFVLLCVAVLQFTISGILLAVGEPAMDLCIIATIYFVGFIILSKIADKGEIYEETTFTVDQGDQVILQTKHHISQEERHALVNSWKAGVDNGFIVLGPEVSIKILKRPSADTDAFKNLRVVRVPWATRSAADVGVISGKAG